MLTVFVAVVFALVYRRSRTRWPGFYVVVVVSSSSFIDLRVVVRLNGSSVAPARPFFVGSSLWGRVWGALSGRFGLASRSGMGSRYLDSALLLPSLSRLSSVPGATATRSRRSPFRRPLLRLALASTLAIHVPARTLARRSLARLVA